MGLLQWAFGRIDPSALDYLLCVVARRTRAVILELVKAHDDGIAPIEVVHAATGVRTKVDEIAQATVVALIQRFFPGFGVQGEEDGLRIQCSFGAGQPEVVVVVDPLDGTEQFAAYLANPLLRRQGVCIMLSVRVRDVWVAAYLLDIFSGEMVRVPPAVTGEVWLSTDDDLKPISLITAPTSLAQGTLLLNRNEHHHQPLLTLLGSSPVFGRVETFHGGIGGSLLQLVMGNAIALGRRGGGHFTAWDDGALGVLCRAAHIKTFVVREDGLQEVRLEPPTERRIPRPHGILYLFARYADELAASGVPVRFL